jgi:hypothetical protein
MLYKHDGRLNLWKTHPPPKNLKKIFCVNIEKVHGHVARNMRPWLSLGRIVLSTFISALQGEYISDACHNGTLHEDTKDNPPCKSMPGFYLTYIYQFQFVPTYVGHKLPCPERVVRIHVPGSYLTKNPN